MIEELIAQGIDPDIAPHLPPNIDIKTVNLDELRQVGTEHAKSMPRRTLQRVEDHAIDGPAGDIALRCYYPDNVKPAGMIIFVHGGGWCIGNLETHDAMCRELCHITGFAVCATDYRLAPEHRFPAGLRDVEAATRWVLDNAANLGVDPSRMVIMGESAGGNLAAVIGQKFRKRLCYQVLVFPLTDFSMPFDSYRRHEFAPGLTSESTVWCREQYLANPGEEQRDPEASPYLADDLNGCPPTYVMTAEIDPLCDDGEAYGRKLVAAGVPVTIRRYLGMPHGFLVLPIELPRIQSIYQDIRRVLQRDVVDR